MPHDKLSESITPEPGDTWFTKRVRRGELIGDAVRVLRVSTINATDRLWVEYQRAISTGRTARVMRVLVPLVTFHRKFTPGAIAKERAAKEAR